MQIELTYSEREMLVQLLEEHCRELRFEISHTDHREYKHALELRLEVLEGVVARMTPAPMRAIIEVA